MEVFIGFTANDDFNLLTLTLESWAELVGHKNVFPVELKPKKYEIGRRVAADNLAKQPYYILADIGCVLASEEDAKVVEEGVSDQSAGMIGLCPTGAPPWRSCKLVDSGANLCPSSAKCDHCEHLRSLAKAPTGVRICRKGVVEKWLPKSTPTYDLEHAECVCKAKFDVVLWENVSYRDLRN